MLYLAQVQKKGFLGKAELLLLAYQKLESVWMLVPDKEVLFTPETSILHEGMLVLVEMSETSGSRQVVSVRDARDWVLQLLQDYVSYGITPALLKQEMEQAEQWRHSLTLQSQELECRALELEARREQIQALENNLKQEQKRLEALATQLQGGTSKP